MKKMNYALCGGVTPEFVSLVYDDAVQILSEIGLEIQHSALLSELSEHAGVTVKGSRVLYAPELAAQARMQVPLENANYATQKSGNIPFQVRPPFSPFNVIDMDTGAGRPATETDVTEGARLYDSYGVTGPVHVHVANIDQRIAQVRIAKLCCENSTGIGNWAPAYSYEQAVTIRDMFLAAGRQEPHVALQITHSPLRLDAYFLDILMRLRTSENGTRGITAGGGAMPLPGVSAPLQYRCAAAQGLAECLGAWITVKLIDPAVHPYASFVIWPPDLSTCTWSEFSPEYLQYDLLTRQVMRELLGLTAYAPLGSLAQMCLHAMQGVRIFEPREGHKNKCFSAAHIPLDQEKLNYAAAFVSGTGFTAEKGLTAKIISETLPETSFLAHESTLEYRSLHWQPEVFIGFTAWKLCEVLYSNPDALLPQAREIARQRIRDNEFRLPCHAQQEIDDIYTRGIFAITGTGGTNERNACACSGCASV